MIKHNDPLIFRFWTSSQNYKPLLEKAIRKLNGTLKTLGVVSCISDDVSFRARAHDYEVKFISKHKMSVLAGNTSALGLCKIDEAKIYILIDLSQPRSETEIISVIMHEMLHAIGLNHTESKHSLMYKSDGVRGLTIYEVRAISDLMKRRRDGGEH
jgi:hypothetical protein